MVAAVTVWGSVPAEACHVQIHYTKSEIDAAHIALYEHEEKLQDNNPTGFDQKHPLLGQLLSNQEVHDNLLQQFESHPKHFEHQYPFLWKVLDGDRLDHEKHPFAPPISPSPVNIVPITEDSQGNPGDPGIHGGSKPGGGPSVGSVPEPSTGVLMLSALIAGLLGAASRRAVSHFRRPS